MKNIFKIKNRTIGDGAPAYIIAEMSANHAGSIAYAKEIIHAAKESGAKVYFSFCPVDADEICTEAFPAIGEWISAYDRLILDTYSFDGNLGSSGDYIFAHQYFYDNAFHPNDYGRVWRTYRMYRDLAVLFGIDNPHNFNSVGFNYEGCLFDPVVNGIPLYTVPWLEQ